MLWLGWAFGRIVALFAGLAYIMISIQVALFHTRQNFRNIIMWLPVIAGPLIGSVLIVLSLLNEPRLRWPAEILLWAGLAGGLLGFILHLRGVGQRVEGFVARNILVGPPIILPLMFSAMGVLGLLTIYWG